MKLSEYSAYDGVALAELLRAGEVSPLELMDCAIARAEAVNHKLNALCCTRFEAARELARTAKLKGRFGALPFLLKDSGLSSRFLETSFGSRLFSGMKSTIEATLNERFISDGFLSFGRTTVPEFCMAPTTEAIQYGGPTLNPWDTTRSCGGSSGGAAVAVATGIVPIAHGSDGGGSIRIPSSCCGVFGLKPSRGLVPHGPQRGEGWGGLAVDGVITRTVRDSAAALDGIAGMEPGQPYASPRRPESYAGLLDRPFSRPLRIAKWTKAWEDIEIADDCLEAVAITERLLAELGHEVVDTPLPALKYSSFVDAVIAVMSANVTVTVNGYIRHKSGIELDKVLEPAILDAYRIGTSMTAETYALAISRFHSLSRLMETYLLDYDYVLTPTLTQLPAKLGELSMQDDFRSFRTKAGRYTTFLAIINASGQPAASLPLHVTKSGLPVGVQLIGRFGQEADLLRISAHLEAVAPWAQRRPPS
jgi:amidase